jgi:hypothetical protein
MYNELEEEYEKHPGGNVRVYQVTNLQKGPDKGKKYYMINPYEDDRGLVARIKDKVKSKTARGGIKDLAKTMGSMGDGYEEKFRLKAVSGWVSRDRAIELRNKLSKNAVAKAGKTYNQIGKGEDK